MSLHPKDRRANNPRLQCSVCGKWKRLRRRTDDARGFNQNFYGGCQHNKGGDHLAGDKSDVCTDCCDTACKAKAEGASR